MKHALALSSAVSLSSGLMPHRGYMTKRRVPVVLELVVAILALISFLLPSITFAEAVMYVSPEKGTYVVGQTFDVKVYADTGGTLINAAEGDLAYDTDALSVESISTDGSILTSWSTKPDFSNIDGTVKFAGWTKKNYSGPNGLLLTVSFKALRNMVGNAKLAAGAILAADGQESNIITSMRSGTFTISAPEPSTNTETTDDGVGVNGTTSPDEIPAKVPAPVFQDIPDTVAVGDHIIIRGTAEPNSHVYFYLAHGSEKEQRSDILTATNGSFTFVSNDAVTVGVYHLRALVETEDGRQSVQSDTIDIDAASTGVAASAELGISLLLEMLPFLALLIFGGLGAAYIYHRHQLAQMHYRGESFFDQ